MADLAPIAPRLAKLLPLLGTNTDGETLATVRALNQTLASAGAEWHAIVSAITTTASPVATAPGPDGIDPADWHAVAKWARDHDDGRLSDKERAFVHDLAAPLRMRRGFTPTARQLDWLKGIYARLSQGAR